MKDDLERFIERRKRADPKFAQRFESGYQEFKIGVLLRQARERAGVTQEDSRRATLNRRGLLLSARWHRDTGRELGPNRRVQPTTSMKTKLLLLAFASILCGQILAAEDKSPLDDWK